MVSQTGGQYAGTRAKGRHGALKRRALLAVPKAARAERGAELHGLKRLRARPLAPLPKADEALELGEELRDARVVQRAARAAHRWRVRALEPADRIDGARDERRSLTAPAPRPWALRMRR